MRRPTGTDTPRQPLSSPRRIARIGLRSLLTACALWTALVEAAGAQQPLRTLELAGHRVEVSGELGDFGLSLETHALEPGVEVALLRLTSPTPAPPPVLSLRWSFPAHDVRGLWTSGSLLNKALGPDWSMSGVTSMLARNAPVLALFGSDDHNRLTFAVSDALNPVRLASGIREEDGLVYNRIDLFTERHGAVGAIEVEVRLDARDVSLTRALADVTAWWAGMPGHEPARVPEVAREPMYSTWYSYHQSVEPEALLREVEIARALGYGAIIVDDGWQTLDSGRGYAFTGDWRPERIDDMKAFVDAVHERGMKVLLWYAVPLVGERSQVYARFRGKTLRYWDGQGAYVLDPRYAEVRAHITDTYRDALSTWGVDGFKLDFLGFFAATEGTDLEIAEGRDHASVNEATDRLMTDIMAELRALNPDVMIEFRQPYIGPLMRKYGNMFRAGDSPGAATSNRVRIVDLRLLSGGTAVHSDMLMWHPGETVEAAALQFLNVLFAVPQLSVRLAEIPAAHRDMVTFYTEYWIRNRSVLLEGAFEAHEPLSNYPLVEAWDGRKHIVALYGQGLVRLGPARPHERIDIVNARAEERVVLDLLESLGRYRYTVTDARGQVRDTGLVSLDRGPRAFEVPASGILALERIRGLDPRPGA